MNYILVNVGFMKKNYLKRADLRISYGWPHVTLFICVKVKFTGL